MDTLEFAARFRHFDQSVRPFLYRSSKEDSDDTCFFIYLGMIGKSVCHKDPLEIAPGARRSWPARRRPRSGGENQSADS